MSTEAIAVTLLVGVFLVLLFLRFAYKLPALFADRFCRENKERQNNKPNNSKPPIGVK